MNTVYIETTPAEDVKSRKFEVTYDLVGGLTLARPFILFSATSRIAKDKHGKDVIDPVTKKTLRVPITRNRKTVAFLINEAGNIVISTARCSPHDQFTRAQGKDKTIGRLQGALNNPSSESSRHVFQFDVNQLQNAIDTNPNRKIRLSASFTLPYDMGKYICQVCTEFMDACRNYKKNNDLTEKFEQLEESQN